MSGSNVHGVTEDIRIGAPPQPPVTTRKAKRRKRRTIALLVGVAAVLAGFAATVGVVMALTHPKPQPPKPAVFTVYGSMTLTVSQFSDDQGYCAGRDGYDDIAAGAQVVITDAAGAVVGVGKLDGGQVSNLHCVFDFVIPGVPDGKPFYGVEVTHRGRVQYSRADLNQVIALSF